jgi:hypothetical protein
MSVLRDVAAGRGSMQSVWRHCGVVVGLAEGGLLT